MRRRGGDRCPNRGLTSFKSPYSQANKEHNTMALDPIITAPDPAYEGATIINIKRGDPAKGRGHLLYANLVSKSGEILISGTLDYITGRLGERMPAHKSKEIPVSEFITKHMLKV